MASAEMKRQKGRGDPDGTHLQEGSVPAEGVTPLDNDIKYDIIQDP